MLSFSFVSEILFRVFFAVFLEDVTDMSMPAVPMAISDFALWPIDGETGRVMVDFDVTLESGVLVFESKGVCFDEWVERDNRDMYLRLANLVRPNPVRRCGVISEEPRHCDGERATFTLNGDISYSVDLSGIVELAQVVGPLFGIPEKKTKEEIIHEPVEAWVYAAKVLNFAVRAESILSDEKPNPLVLDGDLLFQMIIYRSGLNELVLTKSLDRQISELYRRMLTLSKDEDRAFSMATNFGKGSEYVQPLLNISDVDVSPYIGVSHASGPPCGEMVVTAVCSGTRVWEIDPVCSEAQMNTLQSLTESLMQYLIRLHTMHVRLGWRAVQDGHRSYSALDLSFNNHLEYLWHQLAGRHSLGKLGVCEHCGGLFSSVNQRRSPKRFCSPECQSRAKSKRQRERKAVKAVINERPF